MFKHPYEHFVGAAFSLESFRHANLVLRYAPNRGCGNPSRPPSLPQVPHDARLLVDG